MTCALRPLAALVLALGASAVSQGASAQPAAPAAVARSARESAPLDLAGQWVAVVTEDWRFRMVTPPKGDFAGLQLTAAARDVALQWDPAEDEASGGACKAFGAPALMRMPGRIRISWRDDSTLVIEADSGEQTRLLHFDAAAVPGTPSLQGFSRAEWQLHSAGPGLPAANGSLKVTTTALSGGYLRRNGVPYSSAAVLTEYFDVLAQPDGSKWLVVKAILDDPASYVVSPITSSNFRQETDRSGWDPTACAAR